MVAFGCLAENQTETQAQNDLRTGPDRDPQQVCILSGKAGVLTLDKSEDGSDRRIKKRDAVSIIDLSLLPVLNNNSLELSLFSGSTCYVAERNAFR
jgi:hypothetical protein